MSNNISRKQRALNISGRVENKVSTKKGETDADSNENIYYNIRITGKPGVATLATYRENRTVPILENPSDFVVSVERFKIPGSNIPIFIWGDVPNPTKGVVNKLYVTLADITGAPIYYTKVLVFIPNAATPDLYGNSIWNYQEFVDIINVGLEAAFTDLKTANPGVTPTLAPYLTYDAKSQLISLHAQQTYVGEIDIHFNDLLYSGYFPSFQSFADFTPAAVAGNREYKILVKNNFNNSVTVATGDEFVMLQEYTTLFLWNSFQTILFETDTIPIEPEALPSQTNTFRRLMTDFEPLESFSNRQAIQFFPAGPLRWYDLMSEYPLRSIDLKIYWEDEYQNIYPLYIYENEICTVKLGFKKKTANF